MDNNKAYVQVLIDPESYENVKNQITELEEALKKANAMLNALTSSGEISLPVRFSPSSK